MENRKKTAFRAVEMARSDRSWGYLSTKQSENNSKKEILAAVAREACKPAKSMRDDHRDVFFFPLMFVL